MVLETGPKPARSPRQRSRLGVIVALLTILVALLIAVVGGLAVSRYEHYLSGLWVGDPGFLKQAQLRDMQLFLSPREGGCRQGYLLMTGLDGRFVANQAFEMREGCPLQRWWTALRSSFRTGQDAYTTRCAEFEYDAKAPMPSQLKMTVSMLEGTLTLYDGAKVYAFLEKDLAASAAAVEAYAS